MSLFLPPDEPPNIKVCLFLFRLGLTESTCRTTFADNILSPYPITEDPMNHFQRYLTDEFAEEFQEGRLSRRDALKLIASVTGSLLLANSILAACAPPPEETQTASTAEDPAATGLATAEATAEDSGAPSPAPYGTVMPDDPAVVASEVEIPTDIPPLMGYLARPSSETSSPVVLVCHENRGLTPHIQDVTR